MQSIDARRPTRNDTFDLRGQIHSDDQMEMDPDGGNYTGTDDEEHSVLEDDSDVEEREDYMDDDVDDGSSSLSIPNESIDFDLVYSLHSFAATVEGQANVVKGDSLFLMDDSNSYWWLVRVLKTQEVGYIPAENIETPFERLARLNKHRNVDLASATQAELQDSLNTISQRTRQGLNASPSPRSQSRSTKSVKLVASLHVHKYPPAVWGSEDEEDDDDDWDDSSYDGEDAGLAAEEEQQRLAQEQEKLGPNVMTMEADDGMRWDDSAVEALRTKQQLATAEHPASLRAGPDPSAVSLKTQQQQQQVQQQRQQALAQQQQQQQPQLVVTSPEPQSPLIRTSGSREGVPQPQDSPTSSSNSGHRRDPLEQQDTVRMTMTPNIVRESEGTPTPSSVLQQQQQKQEEERKRLREEESEDSLRKRAKGGKEPQKMAPPVSSASLAKSSSIGSSSSGGSKLRKERSDTDGDEGKKKKGVFGGLFGRKKDKDKKDKNGSISSLEAESGRGRASDDSGRPGADSMSPTTQTAMQQHQQQQASALRNSMDPRRFAAPTNQNPQTPERRTSSSSSDVSPHASQLRQKDQEQQALYQQYLNRSPSSPPELINNYGLTNNNLYSSQSGGLGPPTQRPRPGSLILNQGVAGIGGAEGHIPELSVIRVFAGKNLQTEATFKTVLLASSTSSAELVKQALQRFRLPAAEDSNDYYLTVKQLGEGSSAVLMDDEKPLVVFENLVETAMMEMEVPKVKRSSMGSISSISSNLSMHPAIKKLPMNDFSDDSAVKFYLNRRGGNDDEEDGEQGLLDGGEDTLIAADTSTASVVDSDILGSPRHLTVSTQGNGVPAERFSSPSFRFAMQVIIYPDDLPDDMVFDPLTEAIVFKYTLRERERERSQSSALPSPGIPMNMRRKVFVFPKNVTVAEVIEIALERFGILEGVVDGGDEVEDKLTKRRSSARVRYGLAVDSGGQEKELAPSGKVIDAYTRPPTYKAVDRRFPDSKRRSVDSAQLLGTIDDVSSNDPIFILRRATSYRNSTSRHRMSAPLDELALRNLHRESQSSNASSEPLSPRTAEERDKQMLQQPAKSKPTPQEIIAAQRRAKQEKQREIVSTQTNSVRGVDLLLPGNVRLRSSRYDADERMRYSYVLPDGAAYDISDIVEEEWRDGSNKRDLLEGVAGRDNEKVDRLLNKIKKGQGTLTPLQKQQGRVQSPSIRSDSVSSQYSVDETVDGNAPRSRSVTPVSGGRPGARSTTPTSRPSNKRNPSVASVLSDASGYVTAASQAVMSPVDASPTARSTPTPTLTAQRQKASPPVIKRPPIHTKDDFGVSHMLALIEYRAMQPKSLIKPGGAKGAREDVVHPVDDMLFGRPVEMDKLHPKIRDIYADSFKKMAEMDEMLDSYLQRSAAGKT